MEQAHRLQGLGGPDLSPPFGVFATLLGADEFASAIGSMPIDPAGAGVLPLPEADSPVVVQRPRPVYRIAFAAPAFAAPVAEPALAAGAVGGPVAAGPPPVRRKPRDDEFAFTVLSGPTGLDDGQPGFEVSVRIWLPTNAAIAAHAPKANSVLIVNKIDFFGMEEPKCEWEEFPGHPLYFLDGASFKNIDAGVFEGCGYSASYDRRYIKDTLTFKKRATRPAPPVSGRGGAFQLFWATQRVMGLISDPFGTYGDSHGKDSPTTAGGAYLLAKQLQMAKRQDCYYVFKRDCCSGKPPFDTLDSGEYLYLSSVLMRPEDWMGRIRES